VVNPYEWVVNPYEWIGVDLDGTLAEHYWPHKGPYEHTRIGDPIAPMVEQVKSWLLAGETVKIFTARVSSAPNGHEGIGPVAEARQAIIAWCIYHFGKALPVTCVKDYNLKALYDDRAWHVEHNTGIVLR